MKISRYIYLFFALILPFGLSLLHAEDNLTDQLIYQHQLWCKEHVPSPDNLSDRDLLLLTTEAVGLNSHEQQYMDVINAAAERFHIPLLRQMVQIKLTNKWDTCDRVSTDCLDQLYTYATKRYGEVSYESVYCRTIHFIFSSVPYSQATKEIKSIYVLAEKLYKQSPTKENQELFLGSKIYSICYSSRFGNPKETEPLLKILSKAYQFYEDYGDTLLKHYIFYIAGDYLGNISYTFPNYYNWFGARLTDDDNYDQSLFSTVNDTIVLSTLFGDIISNNSDTLILTTNYFQKESIKCFDRLYGGSIDALTHKLPYISFNTWDNSADYDSPYRLMSRFLQELENYLHTYLGENNDAIPNVHQMMRRIGITYGKEYSSDYKADFALMHNIYACSDMAEDFISYMGAEMQLQFKSRLEIKYIYSQIQEIINQTTDFDEVLNLFYRQKECHLQRQGVSEYQYALLSLIDDYELLCKKQNSWDVAILGTNIREECLNLFNDINSALQVERLVLKQIETLVGKQDMLYVIEYSDYAKLSSDCWKFITSTGEEDEKKFFDEYLDISRNTDYYYVAACLTANYYLSSNRYDEALALYREALDQIHTDQKGKDEYYRRNDEMNVMCYYAQALARNGKNEKQFKKQVEQLYDLFIKYPYQASQDVYIFFIYYFIEKKQWATAEDIALGAIDIYNDSDYDKLDGYFVQFINLLIGIYQNGYGDMDKALRVAEDLQTELRDIKDYGVRYNYICLLKALCNLSDAKGVKDITTYQNVRHYQEEARQYYKESGRNEGILHGVLFEANQEYLKLLYNDFSNPEKKKEWYDLKDTYLDDVESDIYQIQQFYKDNFPDTYQNYDQYLMTLFCQMIIYDLEGYTNLSKTCIEQVDSINSEVSGLMWLYYYGAHSDIENGLAHITTLLQNSSGLIETMATYNAYFYRRKYIIDFVDHFMNGRYKAALKPAEKFYELTTDYISQNFDYFTTAEKEAFLAQDGVGGIYIKMLLPYLRTNKLAEQSYDINLKQKGLLLRQADKLKRAILTSGDEQLLASLDSLQVLQRELRQVNMNNINVAVNPEVIYKYQQLDSLERLLSRQTIEMKEREDNTVSWKQVRNALRKGEAAVEYVAQNDVVYALVLTPKSKHPQFVELMSMEDMYWLKQFLATDTISMTDKLDILYNEDRYHLYQKLWQPLESSLADATTVFYSPTEDLNLLSFAAFKIYNNYYLIDKYNIRQLTSTAHIVNRREELSEHDATDISANIYGSIYYNTSQHLSASLLQILRDENNSIDPKQYASNRAMEPDAFPYLLNTLYEADGIERTLTFYGVNATEKIGSEPTEQELRSLSGNSPTILHLATHGFFFANAETARKVPYFQREGELNYMTCSGVVLADSEKSWKSQFELSNPKEDNIFTSAEIAEQDWSKTQLVVLSACQTAVGGTNGEGVFGLQRAVKQAGAKTICASLWNVADDSTSRLMQLFYNYWFSGQSIHKAMKDAMKAQRQITPNPIYWAPFVLIDDI